VIYNGSTSCTVYVWCSVPQGSVLGPPLFILYTADLEDKVDEHEICYHAYADYTQLYLRCRCEDSASVVGRLEHVITDVNQWMSANRLRLNMDKTELIWCGSKHSLSKFGSCAPTIRLGADIIAASEHVRLLRVTLSSELSLEKHVSTVSATCFSHLRQIRLIWKLLDAGSTATLVHAFVTSRVDYCNVVLAESLRSTTDKLQRVMNAAAHVISNAQKYDSGLSLLRHEELHWLDVVDRVRYKLAVLAYRSLHGTAPQYLTSLLTSASEVTGRQYLRSATQQKLIVPRCRRKTFGCRAFSVASPSVWNALPDSLRDQELTLVIFRRHLKTYFFKLY